MIKWRLYRLVMKVAHRYNWHYAPPIYPENDVQLWCKWCGFRQTIQHGPPSAPGGEAMLEEHSNGKFTN